MASSTANVCNDNVSTYTADTKVDTHGQTKYRNDNEVLSAKCKKKQGAFLSVNTGKLVSSKNIIRFAVCVFIISGCSSLIHWNFLLQVLPFVQEIFHENRDHSSTYLGLFQLSNMLMQFVMLKVGSRHPKTLMVSSGLSTVLGLVIAAVFLHSEHVVAGIVGLHILIFILGLLGGFLQGIAFSIAAVLPKNCVGFVSIGQGLSGMFAFFVILALSCGPLKIDQEEGLYKIVWLAFGIAGVVTFINMTLLFILLNHPWASDALEKCKQPSSLDIEKDGNADVIADDLLMKNASSQGCDGVSASSTSSGAVCNLNEEHDHDQNKIKKFFNIHNKKTNASSSVDVDLSEEPARPIKYILKDAAPHLFICMLHFFISFHLFPKVGPILWNVSGGNSKTKLYLFGVFAVFEFLGRSMPDLSAVVVPCICLPTNNQRNNCDGLAQQQRRENDQENSSAFQKVHIFKYFMIPLKPFRILVVLRLVIFVPFILAYVYENKEIINNMWFLLVIMAIHALTQGWYGSLSFIYSTSCVPRLKERQITAPLTVIFVILGVCIGLFLSEIYKKRTFT